MLLTTPPSLPEPLPSPTPYPVPSPSSRAPNKQPLSVGSRHASSPPFPLSVREGDMACDSISRSLLHRPETHTSTATPPCHVRGRGYVSLAILTLFHPSSLV
ncbi:hypothetical protein E2C01_085828 [Portunus trituberculatus]|uniref:Uncharacterized protein n=1 Tax=Portunus trituberculatus TaxID=210409 RepID=A0A5B7J827_PORTR|nr:hypothetical protein [Portunus trituberculatus]